MLGKRDPLLNATRVPAMASELWQAYQALCASRPAGLGPSLVPQSEIQAWQCNHGIRLNSWELDTLAAMDRASLIAAQPNAEAPKAPI